MSTMVTTMTMMIVMRMVMVMARKIRVGVYEYNIFHLNSIAANTYMNERSCDLIHILQLLGN